MYKGIVKEDKRYLMYSLFSKTSLIRNIFSYLDSNAINSKVNEEVQMKYIKECYRLKEEIYELKLFVDLLKEEINKYTEIKVILKPIIERKTYIIKDLGTKLYKIGFSNNPIKREKTLQSEKPNIKMIKVFDKNIEKELHTKYNDFRVRGEWFNLNNIQIKYICTHF
tara:strand:- start:48 stop:548 length:501 start_codon:yes stop_codon:yes gene_type:complete